MSLKEFQRNIPLSLYTTFRIGGPAHAFYEAKTDDEVMDAVQKALSMGLRWIVIGHGSNILASDDGYKGAVIMFKEDACPTINEDGTITASGGMELLKLVDFMAENGKAGLENLAGIPGTLGGAVAGNAGAYGKTISDMLQSALLLGRNGIVRNFQKDELSFSYRQSSIKSNGSVVLKATFRAQNCDPVELKNTVDEKLADRSRKHPDPKRVHTAGSFFKNPLGQDGKRIAAGKLLEDAGCRDLVVGGARLWHAHANIIVTDENASAADVRKLANTMATRVSEKHGITLLPEVCYLD